MHLSINCKDFKASLKLIGDLIPKALKSSPLQVEALSDTEDVNLLFSSGGVYICVKLKAIVKKPGKVVLSLDRLKGLKFSGKDVQLQFIPGKGTLRFKSGRLLGEYKTERLEDLKSSPSPSVNLTHKFDLNLFKEGLRSVCYNSDILGTGSESLLRLVTKDRTLTFMTNDHYCLGIDIKTLPENAPSLDVCLPVKELSAILSKVASYSFEFGVASEKSFRIKTDTLEVRYPLAVLEGSPLVDVGPRIAQLEKNEGAEMARIEFNAAEAKIALQEITSFLETRDSKTKLLVSLDPKAEIFNILAETPHGKCVSSFKLTECICSKSLKFSVFLLLIEEFLRNLEGVIEFVVYSKYIKIVGSGATYMMPKIVPRS